MEGRSDLCLIGGMLYSEGQCEGRGQMPNGIEAQADGGSNWETEVCVALTLLPLSFFVSLFILLLVFEIVSCYVDEPGLELSVTPAASASQVLVSPSWAPYGSALSEFYFSQM